MPQKPPVIGIELRPESRPVSLELNVLNLLSADALGKHSLSLRLGHKGVSGQLKKILLTECAIEWTIPSKPNSRLQQYRSGVRRALYSTR